MTTPGTAQAPRDEIVFTSGGTESNHQAIAGVALARRGGAQLPGFVRIQGGEI